MKTKHMMIVKSVDTDDWSILPTINLILQPQKIYTIYIGFLCFGLNFDFGRNLNNPERG